MEPFYVPEWIYCPTRTAKRCTDPLCGVHKRVPDVKKHKAPKKVFRGHVLPKLRPVR